MSSPDKLAAPSILNKYAAFLFAGGLGGFIMSGMQAKARSSLIAGTATASLMAICGYMTRYGTPVEGDANYKTFMIGIHFGIMLPPIYAMLFSWRAIKAFQDPAKPLYLGVLLTTLAVGSVVTEVMLYALKPKKNKKMN